MMKIKESIGGLTIVAVALIVLAGVPTSAQNSTNVTPVKVPSGAKQKIQGVVSHRDGDMFTVRDPGGQETTVLINAETDVSSHARGLRGKKDYPATYIMRGLRLQAQGVGDSEGNLIAEWVRFDEQDLRSAQAVEQSDELARKNEARIEELEKEAAQAAEQARIMQGQIAENTALANNARTKAEGAQVRADAAFDSATAANHRIDSLDEFDTMRTIPILFNINSFVINTTARNAIDEAAAWAKAEKARGNTKGWLIEVVGFADSTGGSESNRLLSERRARVVVQYLVTVHGLDLPRLVQSFGYGELQPVADNESIEGRTQNRRVEIRIRQNRGIANTVLTK